MINFSTYKPYSIQNKRYYQVPKISFSSTTIEWININLLKLRPQTGLYEPKSAVFSQLDRDKDLASVEQIVKAWKGAWFVDFLASHLQRKDLRNERAFYAIELPEEAQLVDEKICLMETTKPDIENKKEFKIFVLEGDPRFTRGNVNRRYKGLGSVSIYAAVLLAKKNNFESVVLTSGPGTLDLYENILGFENLGLDTSEDGIKMRLTKDRYDDFLRKVGKWYSMPPTLIPSKSS